MRELKGYCAFTLMQEMDDRIETKSRGELGRLLGVDGIFDGGVWSASGGCRGTVARIACRRAWSAGLRTASCGSRGGSYGCGGRAMNEWEVGTRREKSAHRHWRMSSVMLRTFIEVSSHALVTSVTVCFCTRSHQHRQRAHETSHARRRFSRGFPRAR